MGIEGPPSTFFMLKTDCADACPDHGASSNSPRYANDRFGIGDLGRRTKRSFYSSCAGRIGMNDFAEGSGGHCEAGQIVPNDVVSQRRGGETSICWAGKCGKKERLNNESQICLCVVNCSVFILHCSVIFAKNRVAFISASDSVRRLTISLWMSKGLSRRYS